LSASTEELLNFFRSDFRSLPRVGPCGLCGTLVFNNLGLGRFLCSIGVLTPKDTSEKGHLSSTDGVSTEFQKPLVCCWANQENVLRGGVEKSRPERRIVPMDIDSKQIKGLADSFFCDFRNAPCENARIKVAGLSREKNYRRIDKRRRSPRDQAGTSRGKRKDEE
jgi:hypothetical protein